VSRLKNAFPAPESYLPAPFRISWAIRERDTPFPFPFRISRVIRERDTPFPFPFRISWAIRERDTPLPFPFRWAPPPRSSEARRLVAAESLWRALRAPCPQVAPETATTCGKCPQVAFETAITCGKCPQVAFETAITCGRYFACRRLSIWRAKERCTASES